MTSSYFVGAWTGRSAGFSPFRMCPELNPAENVWQFMRDNWLSNRVFASYTDLVDHCCEAWNKLISGPGRSCPSAYATGPMGSDQRKLVLALSSPSSRMRTAAVKPAGAFASAGRSGG